MEKEKRRPMIGTRGEKKRRKKKVEGLNVCIATGEVIGPA